MNCNYQTIIKRILIETRKFTKSSKYYSKWNECKNRKWIWTKSIIKFEGAYAGQLPLETQEDEIKILTNDILENCKVYNYETKECTKIYDMSKKDSLDKYDIYLSGAVPLLTIENDKSESTKELVVFRDSYASSLIPLLVSGYKKLQ